MLSVSYASKKTYSAGKTSGVLRGGVSRANRCYVLAHCAPLPFTLLNFPGNDLNKTKFKSFRFQRIRDNISNWIDPSIKKFEQTSPNHIRHHLLADLVGRVAAVAYRAARPQPGLGHQIPSHRHHTNITNITRISHRYYTQMSQKMISHGYHIGTIKNITQVI